MLSAGVRISGGVSRWGRQFTQQSRYLQKSAAPGTLANLKRLTDSDSETLKAKMASIVGEKNVSLAEAVRSQHGQDEGPDKGMNPDVVVSPGETLEVSEVRTKVQGPLKFYRLVIDEIWFRSASSVMRTIFPSFHLAPVPVLKLAFPPFMAEYVLI